METIPRGMANCVINVNSAPHQTNAGLGCKTPRMNRRESVDTPLLVSGRVVVTMLKSALGKGAMSEWACKVLMRLRSMSSFFLLKDMELTWPIAEVANEVTWLFC